MKRVRSVSLASCPKLLRVAFVVAGLFLFAIEGAYANCPVEAMAGQILDFDSSKGTARIRRGNTVIPVKERSCILLGDRVEVGPGVTLSISAPGTTIKLGVPPYGSTWAAPKADLPSSALRSFLNNTYRALFDPTRPPPIAGIGRGGVNCRDANLEGVLSPLRQLPVEEQKISADLAELFIAWKRRGRVGRTSIQLIDQSQRPVAQTHVCDETDTSLALPPDTRTHGSRFDLRVVTRQNTALVYPLRIVRPEDMPPMYDQPKTGWIYGAWLLASGRSDLRLQALSLLSKDSHSSFGAFRIQSAVLSEEDY